MYSQQKITKIDIKLLKNLRDVEMTFKEDGLTGILGTNGSGKSSLIHALACVYKPNDGQNSINYKFSDFFTPTVHSVWNGSSFKLTHSYRDDAGGLQTGVITEYEKKVDRWSPKYDRRSKRYVSFIGIKTCVPAIESETQGSRILFNTTHLNDAQSLRLLDLGGRVMNRNYTNLNTHLTTKLKRYLGLALNGINYSSLNMGAGEQRIFLILGEVLKAPNYALILIDEIDLLLHGDALKRLINILVEISSLKHLQIIFTTHNHNILSIKNIEFRHIQQTSTKTICYNDTDTEALYRLTGNQIKRFELFVEDDLSKFLTKQVAHGLGIAKETEVRKFGPAINCFTSVCGALLTETQNFENMLFILDGDLYRDEEEKKTHINKVLTGNVVGYNEKRIAALSKVCQFNIPENITPERYYRNLLVNLENNILSVKQIELKNILIDIVNPPNDHDFVYELTQRIGLEDGEVLTLLSDMLSLTDEWEDITQNIREWFLHKLN
jgi:ABC-type lipoprotein export system ATPase subunit